MVVKTAHIDYLVAARDKDKLIMSTWIACKNNRLSLERAYQLTRVDDGVTLLRGRTLFVCVELSTGKPRRMPEEFTSGYGNVCVNAKPLFC